MPSLPDIHARLKEKKRERKELLKAFKDELAHNPRHAQIVEQMKILKEEKKSIENQAWSQSSADAQKVDLLALDIKSDKELLADVALNMMVAGEKVEVIDDLNQRWTPEFSVNMKKDEEDITHEKPEAV